MCNILKWIERYEKGSIRSVTNNIKLELDIILNSVLFYFASKLFILISFNCFASRSMTTILTFFAQCQKGESTKNVITLKSVRFIFTFCYFLHYDDWRCYFETQGWNFKQKEHNFTRKSFVRKLFTSAKTMRDVLNVNNMIRFLFIVSLKFSHLSAIWSVFQILSFKNAVSFTEVKFIYDNWIIFEWCIIEYDIIVELSIWKLKQSWINWNM